VGTMWGDQPGATGVSHLGFVCREPLNQGTGTLVTLSLSLSLSFSTWYMLAQLRPLSYTHTHTQTLYHWHHFSQSVTLLVCWSVFLFFSICQLFPHSLLLPLSGPRISRLFFVTCLLIKTHSCFLSHLLQGEHSTYHLSPLNPDWQSG
jgi:hypothetical protein